MSAAAGIAVFSTLLVVTGLAFLVDFRGVDEWHVRVSRRIGGAFFPVRSWSDEGERLFLRSSVIFLRFMGLIAVLAGLGGILSLFIPSLRSR